MSIIFWRDARRLAPPAVRSDTITHTTHTPRRYYYYYRQSVAVIRTIHHNADSNLFSVYLKVRCITYKILPYLCKVIRLLSCPLCYRNVCLPFGLYNVIGGRHNIFLLSRFFLRRAAGRRVTTKYNGTVGNVAPFHLII